MVGKHTKRGSELNRCGKMITMIAYDMLLVSIKYVKGLCGSEIRTQHF